VDNPLHLKVNLGLCMLDDNCALWSPVEFFLSSWSLYHPSVKSATARRQSLFPTGYHSPWLPTNLNIEAIYWWFQVSNPGDQAESRVFWQKYQMRKSRDTVPFAEDSLNLKRVSSNGDRTEASGWCVLSLHTKVMLEKNSLNSFVTQRVHHKFFRSWILLISSWILIHFAKFFN
jgi:hypothetical protein